MRRRISRFREEFGAVGALEKKLGAPNWKNSWKTGDNGDHLNRTTKIVAPFSAAGAYLMVAHAQGAQFARLFVVSDLVLMQKADRNGVFAFVADAKSGAPVKGARVVLKDYYNKQSTSGLSDANGFFRCQIASAAPELKLLGRFRLDRRPLRAFQSRRLELQQPRTRPDFFHHRPARLPARSEIYFRHIVTRETLGNDAMPFQNAKVDIYISDSKSKTIYSKTLTTSEFGTVNGEWELPADVPLGEFSASARVLNDKGEIIGGGRTSFRVEEYKRPEFEVEVSTPAGIKRPGEVVRRNHQGQLLFRRAGSERQSQIHGAPP